MLPEVFGRSDVYDASRFEYILSEHGGYLPVKIRAVPEGTVVPVKNVLMTIENTDSCLLLAHQFPGNAAHAGVVPCTVATLSREIKKVVTQYYRATASEASLAESIFVLNDFGFRGASSVEGAALGRARTFVNFSGSDTLVASTFAKRYYHAASAPGLSIPATEHSIVTLLGEEGEAAIFKHVLDTFPPKARSLACRTPTISSAPVPNTGACS